jgi:hypothetical protein
LLKQKLKKGIKTRDERRERESENGLPPQLLPNFLKKKRKKRKENRDWAETIGIW